MLIGRDELIGQLEAQGISLGKNPSRTLMYWRKFGLIPKPILLHKGGKVGIVSLHPEETIELIRSIRYYQADGVPLAKVKEALEYEAKVSGYIEDVPTGQWYLENLVAKVLALQSEALEAGATNEEEVRRGLIFLCSSVSIIGGFLSSLLEKAGGGKGPK